jgi:hypothetical protein
MPAMSGSHSPLQHCVPESQPEPFIRHGGGAQYGERIVATS